MTLKLALMPRPALTAFAVAAFIALPAQATVVLDTFGPGDTADESSWALSGRPGEFGQYLAIPFTLAAASTITDVLTSIQGNGTFNLGIVAGSALPSGAFVYSTTLSNPTANSGASGLSWALAAGDFWLVSRPDVDAAGTWQGGPNESTTWAFTFGASDAAWTFTSGETPGARITVSAVPEPATWALMLGGLALSAAAARRRQQG